MWQGFLPFLKNQNRHHAKHICDALQQNREQVAKAYSEIWVTEVGTGKKKGKVNQLDVGNKKDQHKSGTVVVTKKQDRSKLQCQKAVDIAGNRNKKTIRASDKKSQCTKVK